MTAFAKLAATATLFLVLLMPASAQAAFGISSFDGEVVNRDAAGNPVAATQAGSHPDEATATIVLNQAMHPIGLPVPEGGSLRETLIDLPPGFLGNPGAAAQCTEAELSSHAEGLDCPPDSQVGVAYVTQSANPIPVAAPLVNMVPPPGVPAAFGFAIAGVKAHLRARLRPEDDYAVSIDVRNINQGLPLLATVVTFWGVPADPSHDAERIGGATRATRQGFVRLPTACTPAGVGLETRLFARSWSGESAAASFFSHDVAPNEHVQVGPSGCENVPFEPAFSAVPTSSAADSPTGLDVSLSFPTGMLENPDGIATADLKRARVTLPEGMAINPSSAAGLGACSPAQIDLGGSAPATCPASSKLGSVRIDTPLLDHPVEGGVYLAQQRENEFGSLLAIYIAVEDPRSGVVIKLPGKVETTAAGRVTATFDDNPQLPFERLEARFFGGPRAALVNPPACGTYTTAAELAPWSGTPAVPTSSSFQITRGPDGKPCPSGGFDPRLSAGTDNPVAGSHSPFLLRLSREDGTQQLRSLSLTLPEGLAAKLAGVPYCPEPALAGISGEEGTAAAQLSSPSCPGASRVGTVTVGAGAGSSPFHVDTGRAYLAGPYKGAPLSLAVVTPALAGPFDLGTVVTRAALRVNPETAEVTAVSDSLPTVLHGIPLNLRDVRVAIDRPGFILNPTSCDPMSFSGEASSPAGARAAIGDRFQVAGCERLAFKPKLALKLSGKTHRSAHPKLTATLTMPQGGANIRRAQVTLPKTEFLEQSHIRTICTRVQYNAAGGGGKACPKASVYGYAKAWSPLLDQPLQGPVYLRSSSNPLPDLVASLDGQIHIDLSGRIDTKDARIRNTFDLVPDAPVSKFVLTMQGGRKGLLVNNTELCKAKPRADVRFDGQNGKAADSRPLVKVGCGKARKQGKRAKK